MCDVKLIEGIFPLGNTLGMWFFKLVFGKYFLIFLLFLIKLVTLWPLWKSLYVRIVKLIQRRKPENRMRRMFEKELTTESLVFMYQEIYEKLVV